MAVGAVAKPDDAPVAGLPKHTSAGLVAGGWGLGSFVGLARNVWQFCQTASHPKQKPLGRLAVNKGRFLTEPVITVQGLGKSYRLNGAPRDRLWTLLTGQERGEQHWALQQVNFSLKRGQCLGLVGNNGAGKSTLLKLLASTLQPTTGHVTVLGRLTAILELGAGFHPEFTGRENLYFGGSVIGLMAHDIDRLLPAIVEFSELGSALDRQVKTYSSGMVVRLAFSLITAVEPDVLIIDEALAVGDQHFQKKCVDRINQFRTNGCTILFCSHSLYHVRHLCDVSLWIDQGVSRAFGSTEEVLAMYEADVQAKDGPSGNTAHSDADSAINVKRAESGKTVIDGKRAAMLSFTVEGLDSQAVPLLTTPDLVVNITAQMNSAEMPHFGVMLEQANGRGITSVATHTDGAVPKQTAEGLWKVTLTFLDLPLLSGEYVLSAYLFDATGMVVYEEWLRCRCFRVSCASMLPGLVRLAHRWD